MFVRLLLTGLLVLGLTLPVFAGDEASLSWDANTEEDLAGYRVYHSTAPGIYPDPAIVVLGLTTNYVEVFPDLAEDTRYYYTITAHDLTGNESLRSNEVSKVILATPPAPVLAAIPATPTSIQVSWATVLDGAGNPAPIEIRITPLPMSWETALPTPCAVSPCLVTGLAPVTRYELQGVVRRAAPTPTNPNKQLVSPLSAVVAVSTPQIDFPPKAPTGVIVR
jgi:hypothetical protein